VGVSRFEDTRTGGIAVRHIVIALVALAASLFMAVSRAHGLF
jgi:hypothetical protein